MRAVRPRSRVGRPDGAMEGIRRLNSLKPDGRLLGESRLQASLDPRPAVRIDSRVKQSEIDTSCRDLGIP